jgi:hypothetical protein
VIKLTQPRMAGRDGKGMWRSPTRKALPTAGVQLGAMVAPFSWRTITGQVWSKAPGARQWWVVTDDGETYSVHESHMTVLGQVFEDSALFGAVAS